MQLITDAFKAFEGRTTSLVSLGKISFALIASTALLAGNALAEAPTANVGTFESNVEYGVIINGGLAIGGDAALELSVGTVHGDSSADSFLANVTQGDALNIGIGGFQAGLTGVIFNGGLVIGGDMCAKTAIASLGASTCTYGSSFSAESE